MQRFLFIIILTFLSVAANAQDVSLVESNSFQTRGSIIYYQGDYGIIVEVEDILNNQELFKRRLIRMINKRNEDDTIVLNDYIKDTAESTFTRSLLKKAQSGDLMVLSLKTNKVLPSLLLLEYYHANSYQILDPEERIVILDCKYQFKYRINGCPSF